MWRKHRKLHKRKVIKLEYLRNPLLNVFYCSSSPELHQIQRWLLKFIFKLYCCRFSFPLSLSLRHSLPPSAQHRKKSFFRPLCNIKHDSNTIAAIFVMEVIKLNEACEEIISISLFLSSSSLWWVKWMGNERRSERTRALLVECRRFEVESKAFNVQFACLFRRRCNKLLQSMSQKSLINDFTQEELFTIETFYCEEKSPILKMGLQWH